MTLLGPLGERQLGGASEANRHGHVLRSRPPATVLRTAVEERFDYGPAPNEYCPTPLRGADLVSRDREKIERHRRGVDRQFAERLHRVCVKEHAALVRGCRQLTDGLDRADLV